MEQDRIDDAEMLYRSIPNREEMFKTVNGKRRLTSNAFNDRNDRPSVDRTLLRKGPEETRFHPSDGVVSLLTADVRGIDSIQRTNVQTGEPPVYIVDVIARPIQATASVKANPAHAQIETDPAFENKSRFHKLKEALASRGGWTLRPG